MVLAVGSRLGSYEILSALGSGGMGEVYRARDPKLNRDVALKVLPEAFTADPDRLARFKREAQVLAALNHSNIAAIHGFEESDGVQALVLELVDGPTLADRIADGRLAIDEALPIAKQIVEALEAAHEQGIIHRDLKPANIKLRPEGTVKILDFGLAKAIEPVSYFRKCDHVAHDHDPGDDPGRDDPWHGGVHVTGAGEGPRGRQTQRHLGVRVCALRDACREASLRRRRRQRNVGGSAAGRAGLGRAAT